MLSNLFRAIAEALGLVRQRDTELNTEAMRKALEAKREAAAVDRTREAIRKKDLDELRKEIAD
jgi:hypothetical protein